jgi:hypothetical protein
MSDLSEALNAYTAMRHNLGFVFRLPASLLRTFVAFVDQAGSPFITTELVRQWALQPTEAQPSTWAGRLSIARRFAVWRRVDGSGCGATYREPHSPALPGTGH